MLKTIDDFLNNITMYRLVLYYLIFLIALAIVFSVFGILPYNPVSLTFTVLFFIGVSWLTNTIFAKVWNVPTNIESVYISALILALIITPFKTFEDLPFFFWAAVLTIASKYIVNIGKKHIFNPVAFGVTLTALTFGSSATWWIGTSVMLPAVLLGGLLVVRKIRRFDLIASFFVVSLLTIFFFGMAKGTNFLSLFQRTFLDSPILFFAFVMLTEPLTTPPTKDLRIYYGGLVGFLFAPQIHIGSLFTTPEIALVIGNIFSYLVSPKERLTLKLKEKIRLTPDTYDFIFKLDKKINFVPGQYMEFTLGHKNPDDRGNRRYFTLANSPREEELRIGVKFAPSGSSYKRKMLDMNIGDEVVAGQRAGDFTLPKDQSKKLVFVAGGIGITPFRSIIKYLLDTNQKRDIIIFYTSKHSSDFVYKDIFSQALEKLRIKTIYIATENGKRIDIDMIKSEMSDYKERLFYVSGSHSLVMGIKDTLSQMGVSGGQVKEDFFPGFT